MKKLSIAAIILASLAIAGEAFIFATRKQDADEIATMEEGRVVERGTHDDLLAQGGTYARYYRMQFGA